jgi:dTDP-glucose pyrophosphorylase
MNIVIPMSGTEKLFETNGYTYPKNLIEICEKPLIQHVYESLNSLENAKYIFMIKKSEQVRFHTDEVSKLIAPESKTITTESQTKGAACTVLLAIDEINNDQPLIISNGDQIVEEKLNKIIQCFQKNDYDGGIVTFESVHPRWSYVLLNDEGLVIQTSEKRPISNIATAGIYYFKKGSDFVKSCMDMIKKDANVDDHFFVSLTFNEMILEQKKIGIYKIKREQYHTLSTPKDVIAYEKYLTKDKGINND